MYQSNFDFLEVVGVNNENSNKKNIKKGKDTQTHLAVKVWKFRAAKKDTRLIMMLQDIPSRCPAISFLLPAILEEYSKLREEKICHGRRAKHCETLTVKKNKAISMRDALKAQRKKPWLLGSSPSLYMEELKKKKGKQEKGT